MATTVAPRQAPLIPNVVEFAEQFVAEHPVLDAMAAADAAESRVEQMARDAGRRVSDHELAIVGQEVIMAFNRASAAQDRRDRSEWLLDLQSAGGR